MKIELKSYEIQKNLYLIRNPHSFFGFNSYILTIENEKEKVNLVFDPLPLKCFKEYVSMINDIIGIENIDIIYVNHQDPDLTSSVPGLLDLAPKAILLTSQDTWRLVMGYGINDDRYQPIELIPNKKLYFGDEYIQFVPTPFCHFRGATAVYYPKLRVLFSGDLFGGATTKKEEGIYANSESWIGIKLFHEVYMPTKEALKLAIDNIGRLDPIPEMILPQHGDAIRGDLIIDIFKKLNEIEVGLEYIRRQQQDEFLYIKVFNDMLDYAKKRFGADFTLNLLQKISPQITNFPDIFKIENGVITEIFVPPTTAFVFTYNLFTEGLSEKDKEDIRLESIRIFSKYNLEPPEELLRETQRI
ncbi:MAG: histidine kinase, partial [Dictyoglomus sp.]